MENLLELVESKLGGDEGAKVTPDPSVETKEQSVEKPAKSEEKMSSDDGKKTTEEVKKEEIKTEGDGKEKPSKGDGGVFKVTTVNGEEEISLDELKKGYMRQADYTKKTQAISQQRVALENLQRELTEMQSKAVEKASTMENIDDTTFELGEFASDEEKKLAAIIKQNQESLKAVQNELERYKGDLNTRLARERVANLKEQFENDADKHGIDKKFFNIIALFKRQGELMRDAAGVPYGNRYTLEAAINDFKYALGDVATKDGILKTVESDKEIYEAIKQKAIDEYLKEKEKKNEGTFTPSLGGTNPAPKKKEKFGSMEEAVKFVKNKIGVL